MKMKKFLALTATVAMVASMAVGCGNSGNSDKTDGKAETEFDAVLLSSCSELKKKTLQEKK